jgi:hypothetical protein
MASKTSKIEAIVSPISLADVMAVKDGKTKSTAIESKARAAYRVAEAKGAGATVAAAYAAYSWEFFGAGPNAAKTQTAKAWGQTFITAKKPDGVAESTVSTWRVLGKALVLCAVDPQSALWRDLAYEGALATRTDVKKAILAGDVKAVQAAVDVEKAKKSNRGAAKKTASESEASPIVQVRAAVALIEKVGPTLTRDDFAAVEDSLRDLYSGLVTARAEAAKKVAAKRTASKRTAKKVADAPALAAAI